MGLRESLQVPLSYDHNAVTIEKDSSLSGREVYCDSTFWFRIPRAREPPTLPLSVAFAPPRHASYCGVFSISNNRGWCEEREPLGGSYARAKSIRARISPFKSLERQGRASRADRVGGAGTDSPYRELGVGQQAPGLYSQILPRALCGGAR